MPNGIRRVWNVASTVLVVLVVVVAILLVGVRIIGIKPYTVLSGSMRPTYQPGSIIYVVDVDPKDLKVGDPVTFMLNEKTVATHRIIEVIPDETDPTVIRFTTQGDANKDPDGEGNLHSKNVIGTPIFHIPLLGYVAHFVQNPPGRYIALGACALLLVGVIFTGTDKKTAKKDETDEGKKDEPTEETSN